MMRLRSSSDSAQPSSRAIAIRFSTELTRERTNSGMLCSLVSLSVLCAASRICCALLPEARCSARCMACMKNGRSLSEISILNSRAMAHVTMLDSARQTSQPARSRQCPLRADSQRCACRSLQDRMQAGAERGDDARVDRLQRQVDFGKVADIGVAVLEMRIAGR